MKNFCVGMAAAGSLLLLVNSGALAEFDYDLDYEINVPANSAVVVNVKFTGGVDGNGDAIVLKAQDFDFVNGTVAATKERIQAKAPTGTKDRKSSRGQKPIETADTVESAAVMPPLGIMRDFLLANSFTALNKAFQTPTFYGDENENSIFDDGDVSIFGVYLTTEDRDAYVQYLNDNAISFSLGDLFDSPAGGELFPGFRLYSLFDEDEFEFSSPYEGRVVVNGVLREFVVPEPASLALWGLGALGFAVVHRRRSSRLAQ